MLLCGGTRIFNVSLSLSEQPSVVALTLPASLCLHTHTQSYSQWCYADSKSIYTMNQFFEILSPSFTSSICWQRRLVPFPPLYFSLISLLPFHPLNNSTQIETCKTLCDWKSPPKRLMHKYDIFSATIYLTCSASMLYMCPCALQSIMWSWCVLCLHTWSSGQALIYRIQSEWLCVYIQYI